MHSSRHVTIGLAAGAVLLAGALLAVHAISPAAAADGGTITGQVFWCARLPVMLPGSTTPGSTTPGAPAVEGGGSATAVPGTTGPVPSTPGVLPGQRFRPAPPLPRMIPAGAVLVAVQGTGLSARTADDGTFTIDGVPVGTYLTVAAGPVSGVDGAVALRPNVHVAAAGDTVDLGQLTIGRPCAYAGPLPYPVPVPQTSPGPATPFTPAATAEPDATP